MSLPARAVEFEQNVRPEDRWPRLAETATSPAQNEPGWVWGLSEELDELAELHMNGHQTDEALAESHELEVVGADAVSNRGSGKVVVQ